MKRSLCLALGEFFIPMAILFLFPTISLVSFQALTLLGIPTVSWLFYSVKRSVNLLQGTFQELIPVGKYPRV